MSLWDDYDAEMQFYRDFPYDVPSDYWRTKDGTEIKLSDMSESHIRNCMRMVGEDDAWYNKFEEELNKRASKDVEIDDEFDYNNAMASLYPDTEYVINKSAYDCGYEGVKEEIVRCKYCEMCKEQKIYDENGNVEGIEFKCARPIMFLEKGGMSTRSMFFGSNLNGMSVVLQNVKPNGFCAWAKKKLITEETVKIFNDLKD